MNVNFYLVFLGPWFQWMYLAIKLFTSYLEQIAPFGF